MPEHHDRSRLLFAWGVPTPDDPTFTKYEVGLVLYGKRKDISVVIPNETMERYHGDPTIIPVMELARKSSWWLRSKVHGRMPDEIVFPKEAPAKAGPHDLRDSFLTFLRTHLEEEADPLGRLAAENAALRAKLERVEAAARQLLDLPGEGPILARLGAALGDLRAALDGDGEMGGDGRR